MGCMYHGGRAVTTLQEHVPDAVLSDNPVQHLRPARLHVHCLHLSSQTSVALELSVCKRSVAVASGGETARVMLALKAAPASLLAASDNEGKGTLQSACLTSHACLGGHCNCMLAQPSSC